MRQQISEREQWRARDPLSERFCYLYIDFFPSLTAALWGGVISIVPLCRPVLVTAGVGSGVVDVMEKRLSCPSVGWFW